MPKVHQAADTGPGRLGRGRRVSTNLSEINVVPLVDVMLVLLVIFMVTAPLITPSVIDLPTVGKASAPRVVPLEVFVRADQGLVVRTRDGNGRIIDEASVSRADLAKVLKNARGKNEELSVLVGGDKNARYESVLQVMDELRKQGIQRVGLQVRVQQ
jgi:biopolymer transport protein TolR